MFGGGSWGPASRPPTGDRKAEFAVEASAILTTTAALLTHAPNRREKGTVWLSSLMSGGNIRLMFHAVVTRLRSPRTLSGPRSRNWRNPSTDLMMPNTGSGVRLRRASHALPSFFRRRWQHRCNRRGVFLLQRIFFGTFGQRGMMRFTPHRNHRLNPSGGAAFTLPSLKYPLSASRSPILPSSLGGSTSFPASVQAAACRSAPAPHRWPPLAGCPLPPPPGIVRLLEPAGRLRADGRFLVR
jgi:hypothetical protein